jgi:hypothetical protein
LPGGLFVCCRFTRRGRGTILFWCLLCPSFTERMFFSVPALFWGQECMETLDAILAYSMDILSREESHVL